MKPNDYKNPSIALKPVDDKGAVLADIVKLLGDYEDKRQAILHRNEQGQALINNVNDTISGLSIALQTLMVLVPELEMVEFVAATARTLMAARRIAPDATLAGKRVLQAQAVISAVRTVERLDNELSDMALRISAMIKPEESEAKSKLMLVFDDLTAKRNKHNHMNIGAVKKVGLQLFTSLVSEIVSDQITHTGGVKRLISHISGGPRIDADDFKQITAISLDYPELCGKIRKLSQGPLVLQPERMAINSMLVALAMSNIRSPYYNEDPSFIQSQSPYNLLAKMWGTNTTPESSFDFSTLHVPETPGLLASPKTND